jgi:hypothetical protein
MTILGTSLIPLPSLCPRLGSLLPDPPCSRLRNITDALLPRPARISLLRFTLDNVIVALSCKFCVLLHSSQGQYLTLLLEKIKLYTLRMANTYRQLGCLPAHTSDSARRGTRVEVECAQIWPNRQRGGRWERTKVQQPDRRSRGGSTSGCIRQKYLDGMATWWTVRARHGSIGHTHSDERECTEAWAVHARLLDENWKGWKRRMGGNE